MSAHWQPRANSPSDEELDPSRPRARGAAIVGKEGKCLFHCEFEPRHTLTAKARDLLVNKDWLVQEAGVKTPKILNEQLGNFCSELCN